MLRKVIFIFAILIAATLGVGSACSLEEVMNNGALAGAILSLEARGWDIVEAVWEPCFYLVVPKPPYVDGMITVKLVCSDKIDDGETFEKMLISAEAWVVNNRGSCVVRNVTVQSRLAD